MRENGMDRYISLPDLDEKAERTGFRRADGQDLQFGSRSLSRLHQALLATPPKVRSNFTPSTNLPLTRTGLIS